MFYSYLRLVILPMTPFTVSLDLTPSWMPSAAGNIVLYYFLCKMVSLTILLLLSEPPETFVTTLSAITSIRLWSHILFEFEVNFKHK
jgi:hypothetical protein